MAEQVLGWSSITLPAAAPKGKSRENQGRLGRRSAAQSKETRKALLKAAATIFAEKGLNGATIDEIARRAGVTKGAIYSHFNGREDLLVQSCRAALQSFHLLKLAESAPDLKTFVQETARVLLSKRGKEARMLNVEAHLSAGRSPKIAGLLAEWYSASIDVTKDRVPSDVGSPQSVMVMINVLLMGLCHKDAFESLDVDVDELVEMAGKMTEAILVPDESTK